MWSHLLYGVVFAAGITLAQSAAAQIPGQIHQEGLLLDANGLPVTGPVTLRFALYNVDGGGNAQWTEDFNGVALTEGYYSVLLGQTTALTPAQILAAQFLQVNVNAQPLLPRTRLVAVPMALAALSVSGGPVSATTVTVGARQVIDAQGRWTGDVAGLQGPSGAAGPVGIQGPPGVAGPAGAVGGQGSPDTAAQILTKLQTLGAPLILRVSAADDAATLAGRAPAAFLAKAEVGVDIANGSLTVNRSAVTFKADDAQGGVPDVQGTAAVANDAAANALVVAGRRGANAGDRRIELRGSTQVTGNLVSTGAAVLRGGLFVTDANGAARQIFDNQGRWVPNASPLAGIQCDAGLVIRGVNQDGSLICEEGAAQDACGLPIPCNIREGWGQFEYNPNTLLWSACLPKGCFAPARLVNPNPAEPWLGYCKFDENTNALCADGLDNDSDGLADCADQECSANVNVNVCARPDLNVAAGVTFNINLQAASGQGVDAPYARLGVSASPNTNVLSLREVLAVLPGEEILVTALKKGAESANAANVGRYETAFVLATAGPRITVSGSLRNFYDANDFVVVQRLPQYRNVTIRTNGIMTADAWSGTAGGVFAIRVQGTLTIENGGKINMANKGLRGAAVGAGLDVVETFDGVAMAGGGDANLQHGGGVPDGNGTGGMGGTCPYRGHGEPRPRGAAGQAGGAGQFCHQYFDEPPQTSGGGGAPRSPGGNPGSVDLAPTRVYLGGGGANGGGGGGSATYYRCAGGPGLRDGRAGAAAGGCSDGNARGGSGGEGLPGQAGGGIVIVYATTITANAGLTVVASGGRGGAGGGGGGGGHINGGGGGGAGGGGAAGGTVVVKAATRTIGSANIDVTGGVGGGGGGGGGSGHSGSGGGGAGPDGGGGGPGMYYRDQGCSGADGGRGGQPGQNQNRVGDSGPCGGRSCSSNGGAVGGGGGGGGYGANPAGAANAGGGQGCYSWNGNIATPGSNASGRSGGNANSAPVHDSGGGGGRWGPDGVAGVKVILAP